MIKIGHQSDANFAEFIQVRNTCCSQPAWWTVLFIMTLSDSDLTVSGPDSKIMITDFGLSAYKRNNEAMTTTCGTPEYIAPG